MNSELYDLDSGGTLIELAQHPPAEDEPSAARISRSGLVGHSLEWAVGGFLLCIGGAMLVAPLEYDVVWRVLPIPYSAWWGGLFLLAGLALLTVPTLVPPLRLTVLAYLLATLLMFLLAGVYAAQGRLIGVAGHVPLATSCVLALVMYSRNTRTAVASAEGQVIDQAVVLKSALGLCGALSGLVLLTAPALSNDPAFDPVRPFMPWSGLVLLVGGSTLAALPLIRFLGVTRRTVLAVAGVVSGALCLIYVAVALSQNSAWPGIAYFGWFGLVMATQPILDRRAGRLLIPGSLQARLALLLAAAAAVPLILVVALASDRLERAVRTDALAHEESQAIALGQGMASYIDLHQTALKSLAAQPGLTEMPREAQIPRAPALSTGFPRRAHLRALPFGWLSDRAQRRSPSHNFHGGLPEL